MADQSSASGDVLIGKHKEIIEDRRLWYGEVTDGGGFRLLVHRTSFVKFYSHNKVWQNQLLQKQTHSLKTNLLSGDNLGTKFYSVHWMDKILLITIWYSAYKKQLFSCVYFPVSGLIQKSTQILWSQRQVVKLIIRNKIVVYLMFTSPSFLELVPKTSHFYTITNKENEGRFLLVLMTKDCKSRKMSVK